MVLNKYTFCACVCNQTSRSAHLLSLTLTRKLSSGHLAPGRPAVLALMRRARRRQRWWSGGSRVDLLTLSSQRLCIRRETPTDARDHTQSHTTTRTPRHPPPRPTGQWLQFAVNQIGRAVCGLRFDNPERIYCGSAIWGLRSEICRLVPLDCVDYLTALLLPSSVHVVDRNQKSISCHTRERAPPVGPRLVVPTH